MKKIFYLLFGTLGWGSCSHENQEIPTETLPVVDGQKVKTERIATLSDFGIRQPFGLLKSGEEVIVGDRLNNHYIYRLDISGNKSEGMLPRVRTRGGGVTNFRSLASDRGGGWTVLDYGNKKLSCIASLSTRAGGESSIQLPEDRIHLWAIRAGKYVVATGIYPEGRYLLYSPADGRTCYGVDYPEHPLYAELPERSKAMLYASNVLRARPDGSAFVCADMYSGIMDICRIDGGEINLIKRLVYHYPRIHSHKGGEWPRFVYSKDNRFGFTDVCVTEDCIYALYSGQTYRMERKNFQYCRTLLEIGWDGVVRNTRTIDVALTHLAYDAQENSLYGIAWDSKATLVRLDY